MRRLLLSLATSSALLGTPHAALAAPQGVSACYNVGNADARAICLARAHGSTSYCYNVQSPDLRALCLAGAGK